MIQAGYRCFSLVHPVTYGVTKAERADFILTVDCAKGYSRVFQGLVIGLLSIFCFFLCEFMHLCGLSMIRIRTTQTKQIIQSFCRCEREEDVESCKPTTTTEATTEPEPEPTTTEPEPEPTTTEPEPEPTTTEPEPEPTTTEPEPETTTEEEPEPTTTEPEPETTTEEEPEPTEGKKAAKSVQNVQIV